MKPEISYDVIVRRKVPYFTSLLMYVSIIFFIVLWLFNFISSSAETQFAYYMLGIPEQYTNKILFISLVGVVISWILYIYLRFFRSAILTFLPDKIVLKGKRINEIIPVSEIKKAYCMDSNQESPNEKLTIYLEHRDNKMTMVRLKYIELSEEFMEKLLDYKNINFKTYNFDVDPDLCNEE